MAWKCSVLTGKGLDTTKMLQSPFPFEMKRAAGFECTQGKYRGLCQAKFSSSTSLPSLLEVGLRPGALTQAVGV